jgi:hypothetical protein
MDLQQLCWARLKFELAVSGTTGLGEGMRCSLDGEGPTSSEHKQQRPLRAADGTTRLGGVSLVYLDGRGCEIGRREIHGGCRRDETSGEAEGKGNGIEMFDTRAVPVVRVEDAS